MSDPKSPSQALSTTPAPTPKEPGFPKAVWNRWSQMARAIGVVQTRFLLVVFFMVVVLPTGIFVRATGDRLRLKPPKDSNWVPLEDKKQDLDAARRQF
jgi:hypothetical protein